MTQPHYIDRGLKTFPPETEDVQSRFILVHQLRASADIQDNEITRTMGRKATTDRASLMREAAALIERLAAPMEAVAWRYPVLTARDEAVARMARAMRNGKAWPAVFQANTAEALAEDALAALEALAVIPTEGGGR